MIRKSFLSLLLAVFVTQLSVAINFNDSIPVQLSAIEVNANKTKLYSEMGRILTVIDRAEIEKLPVKSLDALLENIPGIDIRQRGTDGTQADISMRGGTFDQVLVLLNGVNITDPQTGHYNLDIPAELSDVSRIEILQGSAARLLGPNAFSGAINIVTEQSKNKSLSATVEGGSYNSYLGNLSASLGKGNFKNFASITHKASEGYAPNTDYIMTNAFIHSALKTPKAGKFDLQLAYQQKAYGADGFYHTVFRNQFENTKTLFGALNWNLQLNKVQLNAQIYNRLHHDRFEFFRNFENAASWYSSHYYHLTNVTGGKASANYLSSFGKFTFGTDIRNEHIYSTTLGKAMSEPVDNFFEKNIQFVKEDNRLSATVFADYALSIDKFYLSAGIAQTHNQAFGNYTYGGIDLGYKPNATTNIYMAVNNALRLPTFTDLYYSTRTHQADPNLKPEHAKTIETGAKFNKNSFYTNISVFYRIGEDVIDWVKYNGEAKYKSANLATVNTFGGELSAGYIFRESFLNNIQVGYSYLNSDKKATNYDSQYALDYLKHKATLDMGHKIYKGLNAMWSYGYFDREGTFYNTATTENEQYKPYHMLNVKLQYKISDFDIYAGINNLLNISYLDFGGMPQPGFNFRVGIKYQL
jgi:iron complex outermembrane receptor protein